MALLLVKNGNWKIKLEDGVGILAGERRQENKRYRECKSGMYR